jgi:hypothetical protein
MGANHLCCLTSDAPDDEPSRLCSSLTNSLRIADLHILQGERRSAGGFHQPPLAIIRMPTLTRECCPGTSRHD